MVERLSSAITWNDSNEMDGGAYKKDIGMWILERTRSRYHFCPLLC